MFAGTPRFSKEGCLECPCGQRLRRIDAGGHEMSWSTWQCSSGHTWDHAYGPQWRKVWNQLPTASPTLALLPLGWERGR